MSYRIVITAHFEKEIKRLSKKYSSLKADFANLLTTLQEDPLQGDTIRNNCYKVRLAIKSKGKGKSGGARVITHVYVTGKTVYLISIYDKAEKDTISDKEIEQILKAIKD